MNDNNTFLIAEESSESCDICDCVSEYKLTLSQSGQGEFPIVLFVCKSCLKALSDEIQTIL